MMIRREYAAVFAAVILLFGIAATASALESQPEADASGDMDSGKPAGQETPGDVSLSPCAPGSAGPGFFGMGAGGSAAGRQCPLETR